MGNLGKEALKAETTRILTSGKGAESGFDWYGILKSEQALKDVAQLIILEINELRPTPTAIGFSGPIMGVVCGTIAAMSGFRIHPFLLDPANPHLAEQLKTGESIVLLEEPAGTEPQKDLLDNYRVIGVYRLRPLDHESIFGSLLHSVL